MYTQEQKILRLARIVHAELRGELNDQDRHLLEAWLDSSAANRALFESFKQEDNLARKIQDYAEIDPQQDYRRFMALYASRRKRNSALRVLRYAAVLLLPICTYLLLSNPFGIFAPARLAGIPEEKKVPVLVLGDGRQVPLMVDSTIVLEGKSNVEVSPSEQKMSLVNHGQSDPDNTPVKELSLIIPRGGFYALTLPDNTKVWLNSESELYFPSRFDAKQRRVSLNGEAYFEVAKKEGSTFIVETWRGEVEVLGTSFNLSSYANDRLWHVTLAQGVVDIRTTPDVTKGAIRLLPDQRFVLDRNNEWGVLPTDPQQYSSWRNGFFAFEEMSLRDIGMRLERWYDIEIEFADEIAANEHYTGLFSKSGSIEEVFDIIVRAKKITLQKSKDRFIISSKPFER